MSPNPYFGGYGKQHYEFLGALIPLEHIDAVEATYAMDSIGRLNISCTGYKPQFKPGEELQKLIDLGYTEEQGVTMLDSIKED